jgi:hypothetical protein
LLEEEERATPGKAASTKKKKKKKGKRKGGAVVPTHTPSMTVPTSPQLVQGASDTPEPPENPDDLQVRCYELTHW